MKQLSRSASAIGCAVLAALLAAPVGAQTYGNNGSTAAGPGTGASVQINGRTPPDGSGGSGGWGIWGVVGLLGLFGIRRRYRARTLNEEIAGTPPSRSTTPTITETTTARERVEPDAR